MWRDDDVGHVPVRAFAVERLDCEHIERRAPNAAVLERFDKRGIVDQLAAGDVDQEPAVFHRGDFGTADQALRFGRERRGDDNAVAGREQVEETVGRPDLLDALWTRLIDAAPDDGHYESERGGESRDFAANRAETDDAHAHALERPNGGRTFELLLRPVTGRLRADGHRQMARERDGDTQDVLGDGPRPDPACA